MPWSAAALLKYWRDTLSREALPLPTLLKEMDEEGAEAAWIPIDELRTGRLSDASMKVARRAGFLVKPGKKKDGQDRAAGETKPEDEEIPSEIWLCPVFWVDRRTRGRRIREWRHLMPVIIPATLDPAGWLRTKVGRVPWVPHELLEVENSTTVSPLPKVAMAEKVDDYLTEHFAEELSWATFLERSEGLLSVTREPEGAFEVHSERGRMLVLKGAEASFSKNLLKLYDALIKRNDPLPLLDCLTRYPAPEGRGIHSDLSWRWRHSGEHLAQMQWAHGLSESQRNALIHVLSLGPTTVAAVNGPPGTGKTTLLQSVVASVWVKAALERREPPIIAAASTNNQAVTNIIESMGAVEEHPDLDLAGRWIPSVSSFGLFLASQDQQKKAAGKGYQCVDSFGGGFESELRGAFKDGEQAAESVQSFLKRVQEKIGGAVSTGSVSAVQEWCHAKLKEVVDLQASLSQAIETWPQTVEAEATARECLRKAEDKLAVGQAAATAIATKLKGALAVRVKWLDHVEKEPWYYSVPPLSWFFRKKRRAYAQRFPDGFSEGERMLFDRVALAAAREPGTLDALTQFFDEVVSQLERDVETAAKEVSSLEVARTLSWNDHQLRHGEVRSVVESLVGVLLLFMSHSPRASEAWASLKEPFPDAEDLPSLACLRLEALVESLKSGGQGDNGEGWLVSGPAACAALLHLMKADAEAQGESVEEARFVAFQACLDVTLRFLAFRFAVHYWEAAWYAEVFDLGEKARENDRRAIAELDGKTRGDLALKKWRRYQKLTPCLVSTFFMLPRFFNDGEPLFEAIDLLIVDEAGQVNPEVAGACFALARQALVVGDTFQIPPVHKIVPRIDFELLRHFGILDAEISFNNWEYDGRRSFCSSLGNLMEMAQNASPFWQHREQGMPPGLMLLDHRRCQEKIIAYCNELSYRNLLKVRTEPIPQERRNVHIGENAYLHLPAMGHCHLPFHSETVGASRRNSQEAHAIVLWLLRHSEVLETHYNLPIEKIVAILTPFSGQKKAIQAALDEETSNFNLKLRGRVGDIVVGTVHAMQGAERPVVLFSSTYGSADSVSVFSFDRLVSILNVAVSRAKDSFLVFGNMEIFSPSRTGTASGLLARHLFREEDNALTLGVDLYGSDDAAPLFGGSTFVDTLEKHLEVLHGAVDRASEMLLIVSPFLRMEAVLTPPLLAKLKQAVDRGVQVYVVSDWLFNIDERTDSAVLLGSSRSAVDALIAAGVQVELRDGIHSKLLLVDGVLLVGGSFNWLSASRNPVSPYARYETSFVHQGEERLQDVSRKIIDDLNARKQYWP